MSVTRIVQRVSGAKLFINGKPAGTFDGAYSETEPEESDAPRPFLEPVASFSFMLSGPLDSSSLEEVYGKILRGSRKAQKRRAGLERRRRQGKPVNALSMCGLCASLGRSKAFATQYGLRMHLAQGRHGTCERGFNVSWRKK